MKLRKLFTMLALALLIVAVLAVPAQAEPPKTEFDAALTTTLEDLGVPRVTGSASHTTNTFEFQVNSPDERFRGTMKLVAECKGPGEDHPNAVYMPDWGIIIGWGPCNAVWRLEVTADSGWEGQDPGSPQADYRNGKLGNANGVGYGDYKGMTVKWVQHDIMDWVNGLMHVTIKQDK